MILCWQNVDRHKPRFFMPFQAQPRRKTICKSLINPVDMLLTECGNIGAVESVDKAGVFPRVANWLSISVFQAAAEFFGIFNAADTTITSTTIYLYNNEHIGESEIVLSTFFLFSFQEKRKAQRKQEKIKGHKTGETKNRMEMDIIISNNRMLYAQYRSAYIHCRIF